MCLFERATETEEETERQRERDIYRESASISQFTPQMATTARSRQSQSQELPLGLPRGWQGSKALGLSSAAIPGTLIGAGLETEQCAISFKSVFPRNSLMCLI